MYRGRPTTRGVPRLDASIFATGETEFRFTERAICLTCVANDTVAKMRRTIESTPRRWLRLDRAQTSHENDLFIPSHTRKRKSQTKRVSGTVYMYMKRADLGLRPRSTRIHHPNRREILGVPSLHFRHMYNFVYRLEFIDASRRLCERERRSIIGLHPRSSFCSAPDASGFETNNHVQTRTAHAPEVYRHTNMAQCFRHVSPPRSPARKAHVLHLRYHACTAPTCLRTLVFRVRVSLLRSVIRYVQKLRLIDWKDHVSLARCTLTSQENAWKPAIYDNLYAPGIKADCCTLYINCYVRRANLLVVANKNTLCEFFTSRCNMLYKICLEFY